MIDNAAERYARPTICSDIDVTSIRSEPVRREAVAMNTNEMYDVMRSDRFKPFAVHYLSGRRFVVSSQDQAILSSDKRTLVLARSTKSTEGSGIDLIDVALAEQIEILPEPPKSRMWWISNNGH